MNLLIINDTKENNGLIEDFAREVGDKISFAGIHIDEFSEKLLNEIMVYESKYICSIDIKNIRDENPNDVYILLKKYDFVPIIITENTTKYSLASSIFYTLVDEIKHTMLYIHNEEYEQYDELVKEVRAILLLKGDEDA